MSESMNDEISVCSSNHDIARGIEELQDGEKNPQIDFVRNRYQCKFHVDRNLFGLIIGRQGTRIQELQTKSDVTIKIPRQTQLEEICITGNERENVAEAWEEIQMITKRKPYTLTHFVSIPMNNTDLQKKFTIFKDAVLKDHGKDRGICEDLFQNPEKLHLTVGVMDLSDNGKENSAIEALDECKKSVIDPLVDKHPIIVHVKGVQIMNRSSILYARIVDQNLQSLADNVANYLTSRGLMKKEKRKNVLLHLTLMNTKFVSDKRVQRDSGSNCLSPTIERDFNATNILRDFADYEFGEVKINAMHLSEFHETEENGYYKNSHTITF